MNKIFLLCLLVVAISAVRAGERDGAYRPTGSLFQGSASNQFSQGPFLRKDSGERFSGFDSKERFDGGFRQGSRFGSDERFDGGLRPGPQPQLLSGSGERFSGGFSNEIQGRFAPGPVRGFGGAPRVSGGFGGGFVENVIGGPVIAILRDDREDSGDGAYSFVFESEDGIKREESGTPTGPGGAVVKQGSWSFTYPDGTPAEFRFVADENGYQVDSNLLPQPHPIPPHALAQIEKAERERAAGIIHDGQYRAEDHFGGGVPLPGQFGGPGPDSLRRFSGTPQVQPQLISGFKDSSIEDASPFRGSNRFQSSFERDSFPNQISHFGGGLPQSVGVPLRSANTQRFGVRSGSSAYN